jgi:transposase
MEEENKEELKELKEQFPLSFKRWLAREIESGKMSVKEATERFRFDPRTLIDWLNRYSLGKELSLAIMTPEEKQEKVLLEKRIKELEKALDYAKLKNIAVETMIDIAEKQFKISIRKKAGPKQ